MAVLTWDAAGSRYYETGVDRGVLYIPDALGAYSNGVAWNGLVTVTEKPTGAESNPMYADNMKYLNLYSIEQFGATIEAYTYPDEWNQFDGLINPGAGYSGVQVGQQARKTFGLSYRTKLGNDTTGDDYGYKLHLMYGAIASPTERGYSSINDTPEPMTFSWDVTTTPVAVTAIGSTTFRSTSLITIDSTRVSASALTQITNYLWGTAGANPQLPTPDSVLSIITNAPSAVAVTPTMPTFTAAGGSTVIPTVTGVTYKLAATGATVTGTITLGTGVGTYGIYAVPTTNAYYFTPVAASYWSFTRTS
jgi:hypothetical protein